MAQLNTRVPHKRRLPPDTTFKKVYLSSYSLVMFMVYSWALYDVVSEKYAGTFYYDNHYKLAMFLTLVQLVDILNSCIGFTTTRGSTASLQIIGRMVILVVAHESSKVWSLDSTFALLLVYYIGDIIRYSYYFTKTANLPSELTTHLRYNAWIILYPIGFAAEAFTIYRVYRAVKDKDRYTFPDFFGTGYNLNTASVYFYTLCVMFPLITLCLYTNMAMLRDKFYAARSLKKTV